MIDDVRADETSSTGYQNFQRNPVLDTHLPSGGGRKEPLAGDRFEWERSNPTGCPGKVSLDEDIGLYPF